MIKPIISSPSTPGSAVVSGDFRGQSGSDQWGTSPTRWTPPARREYANGIALLLNIGAVSIMPPDPHSTRANRGSISGAGQQLDELNPSPAHGDPRQTLQGEHVLRVLQHAGGDPGNEVHGCDDHRGDFRHKRQRLLLQAG
jgi:hypothetical protein